MRSAWLLRSLWGRPAVCPAEGVERRGSLGPPPRAPLRPPDRHADEPRERREVGNEPIRLLPVDRGPDLGIPRQPLAGDLFLQRVLIAAVAERVLRAPDQQRRRGDRVQLLHGIL